jgi:hypothetical protein
MKLHSVFRISPIHCLNGPRRHSPEFPIQCRARDKCTTCQVTQAIPDLFYNSYFTEKALKS